MPNCFVYANIVVNPYSKNSTFPTTLNGAIKTFILVLNESIDAIGSRFIK